MNLAKRFTLLVLFSTLQFLILAQNIVISSPNSDTLTVCNADTFTLQVQNNLAVPLTGALLTTGLPSGLRYVAGTVSGASEQNISNLSAPIFSLPDVLANQLITLKILIHVDCDAADLLDMMQVFVANISISSALGNAQFNTNIKVETGGILIQSVSPAMLMGELGDTLERVICVQNTRVGKIGQLNFDDLHLEGFYASVLNATSQINGPTLYSAEFDGSFFESVGNGDRWLDQFESVCFTEQIVITSCGIPTFSNPSILRAGWGCGGEVCRYDTFTPVFVQIKPSTKIPALVFEQVWAPPTDYCGNTPAVMGFKITNVGQADAKNIIFNIELIEGLGLSGVNLNSFRIVTPSGSTNIAPSANTQTILPNCGLNAVEKASLVLPLIAASTSIQFLFDVITCVPTCDNVQPVFRADYLYTKDCPVNGFVSGNETIRPEEGYLVNGTLRSALNSCLDNGQSYLFNYELKSKYMTLDGFIHFEIELPRGINLNDSCATLLGNIPPVLNEITPLANGNMNLHLAWATPLPMDSMVANFCLEYLCDSSLVCEEYPLDTNGGIIFNEYCCIVKLKDEAYWTPSIDTDSKCGIKDCNEQLLGVNFADCQVEGGGGGGIDSTCCDSIFPLVGLRSWWNAYRLNLGFQDNNDDRYADNLLPPSLAVARRDRFLAGDTLRVEFCAVMDSAVFSVETISRAIWHEIVASDRAINDNDTILVASARLGFTDQNKVRLLGNTVRVRYADGTEASCAWSGFGYIEDQNFYQVQNQNAFPPQAIDEIASEKFYFLFSLPDMFANGCLPKPMLEEGDSIFILTDFKLDVNFKPSSENDPDPPLIGFRTASSFGGDNYAWNQQPRKYFQYSGWKKSLLPNVHSIKPCENSSEVKKFRYSMRIARENMFPFEVRPLAWISDYRQSLPPGLELASAKLEYLTLQDSVPFHANLNLPFSQSPGYLDVDFAPAFTEPVDEGFTLRSNLIFKPNCQFNVPDTSKQYIETSFVGCLNGDQMTMLDSLKNPIGFFSNTPRLQVLSDDAVLFAPSRAIDINFDLKNLVVSPALAAWVAVLSPSGQASDFELFLMPQNQAITGTNGFFNVGALNGFSQRSFRLKGQNLSCDPDSLLLLFGWGCAPVTSLADADCGRDTFLILLHLERPELELDVLLEPASLTLCDTSDWFEFEIYNAKIGYAYDLEASVRIPQGLRIVPGTCQISYPEGAPWTNIVDPTLLSGNLFQWKVNTILPLIAANGLPGIDLTPQNTFHIRFKTIAECGFVSNTPILYGTTGIEPCGRQTNALNKPGDPLNILGLAPPPYGVQISIQPIGPPGAVCGGVQDFTVDLNILGTPSAGDSLYILLPADVAYQPGSYVPGLNGPSGPPTLHPFGFQLPIPILVGGGMMQFRFRVELGTGAGCDDRTIVAQTRVRTDAFCQSLGAPCEVYISTGEDLWNLEIEHTQLSASNFQLSISNGLLSGSINLANIGTTAANGATAQIWRDLDGDGMLSAGDLLLQTLQTAATIAPGATILLAGILPNLDSTQLCGLLLVLPEAENCTCDDQVFPLENLNLKHTALIFCELKPVTLGVPEQMGFSYQWQPASAVACASCPSTVYTPSPNTPLNTPQTLTLIENSTGCAVTHTFEITFGGTVALIMGNPTICEGTSTVLTASPPGTSYFWQGPGIQTPNQASQTVQVATSSFYGLTITFANGCTASDLIEIEVLNADTVQLAALTTCEGVPVDVLGTMTVTPGTYQIVAANGNGCDSTTIQTLTILPEPITEEQRVFCFGDSLLVFDSLFTESGTLTLLYSALNGCDSIHLVTVTEKQPLPLVTLDTIFGTYGQIITLTGPDGYVTYLWEPTPTPPCPNCPTVNYPADSSGYHEYLLTVIDGDDCSGELLFRVVVFPPCSADSLRIPNAFTPNGDGKNDVFRVVKHEGAEVVSSLEIYDRWGEKVYENQGNAFWDGTINGEPGPSDVYVYIVKITCGELVSKRVGDVTLLR